MSRSGRHYEALTQGAGAICLIDHHLRRGITPVDVAFRVLVVLQVLIDRGAVVIRHLKNLLIRRQSLESVLLQQIRLAHTLLALEVLFIFV